MWYSRQANRGSYNYQYNNILGASKAKYCFMYIFKLLKTALLCALSLIICRYRSERYYHDWIVRFHSKKERMLQYWK